MIKGSSETVLFSRYFVMYYVHVTSGPSLLMESTDNVEGIAFGLFV